MKKKRRKEIKDRLNNTLGTPYLRRKEKKEEPLGKLGQPELCPGEMQWLSYEELPESKEMDVCVCEQVLLDLGGVGVALEMASRQL